jgi:hypothetical protein
MGQRGGVLVFLASDSSQATVEDRCAGYFPAAGPSFALKAWRAPWLNLSPQVAWYTCLLTVAVILMEVVSVLL